MELKEGYIQTEVGIIPEDWNAEHIKKFALITTGSSDTQDKIDDGIYPFYVRSQKVERINQYTFDGEAVLTSGDGVGVGKIFHYARGKFDFHQRVYCIYNFNKVDGKYFYLQFSSRFFDRVMSMTAKSSVDSVRMEMIADMKIPLPPTLTEQKAIARVLSDTDALIQALEKKIAKKKLIKKGVMQKLLTPKDGWKVRTLGEIFTFYSTSNFSKAEMSSEGEVGCIHYGLIHAIDNTCYSLSKGVKYYITQKQAKYETVQEGDVVMVDASEDLVGLNKSVEIVDLENKDYIAGLHTFHLRDKNSIYVKYFRGLLLNSIAVKRQMLCLAVGMKVFGVSKPQLRQILLPVPPMEEQENIAQILSDMDTEIKQLEQKVAKYNLAKQGMMQQLLTGKIRLVKPNSKAKEEDLVMAAEPDANYNNKAHGK